MLIKVDNVETHIATGGREHHPDKPWMVFIHGSGFNHLSWMLQTRALAYDGWNVLAPDLPGHYLSKGDPLEGIEAMADWMLKAMDAVDCQQAVICAHSMGGLIALEMAHKQPDRVRAIIFVATADAIPVNKYLLDLAAKNEDKAFASMVAWAHGEEAHNHENTWPGSSLIYNGMDIMRLNQAGTLSVDLNSCNDYADGAKRAKSIKVPTLCVLSKLDRMTPIRGGMRLADALGSNETITLDDCGHSIPGERPRELNSAIRIFLSEKVK
ncbi:MAG: alpha/beta fold hydrolase [Rhizobiaceae bacterium]